MKYWKAAGAALAVACLAGATTTSGTAAAQPDAVSPAASAQTAEAEFVSMMIPHHHQALVMSRMVPDRSSDESLGALANRIDGEQGIEILVMQGWQSSNELPVTDPVSSYEALLDMPEMLEQMGMATREELDAMSALDGTAFDVMFLELMIDHHQGAIDMAVDVIINGTDYSIQNMATEMMASQRAQILQMEAMLADKT